jgi:hypothetical protein
LAKALINSNSELVGESITYSIPRFWNLIEKTQSKEDHKFDQNSKRSREKKSTKWKKYFRVKYKRPAER